jgi:hypothetical protein
MVIIAIGIADRYPSEYSVHQLTANVNVYPFNTYQVYICLHSIVETDTIYVMPRL